MAPRALDGVTVIELSGLYGAYAGKLFADLGAHVTLVEPPGGSPMRAKPPFAGDVPGPENSLAFAYYAANKSGVVIDLATDEGQWGLAELVGKADLVILSDHPQAALVNLAALQRTKPSLVCIRITPFGADGPYSGYVGDDLTLMAMGGLLTLAGYPDRSPVVAYGEQGFLAADQFAAVSSLAAVLHAERTGEGELIDLSIQESVAMALENATQAYQLEGHVRKRAAGSQRAGTGIFPCKDGDIYLLAGGIGETAMWSNFARWMAHEGVEGASVFASENWDDTSSDAQEIFTRIFQPYALKKTKLELYGGGQHWKVPIAPMSTPGDLLADRQLAARGFFALPPDESAHAIRVPGAPYKLSRTPWALRKPAPRYVPPSR